MKLTVTVAILINILEK